MANKDLKIISSINKKRIAPAELSDLILTRLFFLLIVFLLPLTILSTSSNIVLRIPDLYGYEIKNNNVGEEFEGAVLEDTIADKFSHFFLHKTNSLSLTVDYGGSYGNVFTKDDTSHLKNVRLKLDIALGIAAVLFIFVIVSFMFLFRKKYWKKIRNATILSLALTVILAGIVNAIAFTKDFSEIFFRWAAGGKFAKESVVFVFFKSSFGTNLGIIISVMSVIFLAGIFLFILYLGKMLKMREKKF